MLTALQWILFDDDALPGSAQTYRIHPIDWDSSQPQEVQIDCELEFEHSFERLDRSGQTVATREVYLARRQAVVKVAGADEWSRRGASFQLYRKSDAGWTPATGTGELELRQILGSSLRDLFFTDGDRALSFITADMSLGDKRKLVRGAIRDMLALEMLERANGRVKKALDTLRSKTAGVPNASELDTFSAKIADAELNGDQAEVRAANWTADALRIALEISSLEQKVEAALVLGNKEQLVAQRQGISRALDSGRLRLENHRKEHSESFKQKSLPLRLLQARLLAASGVLEDLKKKGKLPRTAMPILAERLEMGVCICGTPLTPGTAAWSQVQLQIEEQKATSEIDDRLTELRITAAAFLRTSNDSSLSWESDLRRIVHARETAERDIADREAELKLLETTIDQIPDTDIGFLKQQKRQFNEAREKALRERSREEDATQRWRSTAKQLTAEYNRLVTQSDASKRLQARLTGAEDIGRVLRESYAAIEKSEVPEVSRRMNTYFLEMIGSDSVRAIIREAAVTPNYDIVVYGPERRALDPDRDLNGASRRALTLAFILALTEVSGVTAPGLSRS